MGLFDILHKKKTENEQKDSFITKLDHSNVYYDMDETERGYEIIYMDVFDNEIFTIKKEGESFFLNGALTDEDEILKKVIRQGKLDAGLSQFMSDPIYDDIFDVYEFFSSLTSDSGLTVSFIAKEEVSTLYLLYGLQKKPDLEHYLSGVKAEKEGDKVKITCIPDNLEKDADGTVLYILKKIYEAVPIFFTSGNYKPDEDSRFKDNVVAFLMNLTLVKRLNEISDVEAHVIDAGNTSSVFVVLKNGAAIEFISPTKQNPNGKLSIIDVDEEAMVEDNEAYYTISKILRLPTFINDKPDENRMPKTKFSKNGRR